MALVYIVEDEIGNLNRIMHVVSSNFSDIVIQCATDLKSATALFHNSVPDLAILDIEYPDGNAFELLRNVPTLDFTLIFISGYEKYALQAIRFAALDYILKPIVEEELIGIVSKALSLRSKNKQNSAVISSMLSNYHAQDARERQIVLKTFEEIFVLNTSNIVHCVADNNYTTFYLDSNEKVLVSKPIKEYEDLLCSYRFMRVHQSHLVNLTQIRKFDKRDGGTLIMRDNSHIPVSTRKKPQLMEYFASLE